MVVTKVAELAKNRSKVYIDEEFAFVLYKGELRIYKVRVGQEITEEAYSEITERILPKRAKLRCMNLLKTKSYTRKQLEDKLRDGFYPENIITIALDYVASFGYINDEQYTHDYIEYYKEQRSKSRIMNDLLKKGIDKELFEQVWEETIGDEQKDIETAQILKLLEKKKYCDATATYEERQKIFAFLYRKGFKMDAIRNAVSLDITSICV